MSQEKQGEYICTEFSRQGFFHLP